jgi:hypothetical protein
MGEEEKMAVPQPSSVVNAYVREIIIAALAASQPSQ